MSYAGSTASTPNPPVLIGGGLARGSTALTGNSKQLWMYTSTNLSTDILGAGFFSDGQALGMKAGDIVIGTQYTSAGSSVVSFICSVSEITTAGAATLSTGGSLTSTHA